MFISDIRTRPSELVTVHHIDMSVKSLRCHSAESTYSTAKSYRQEHFQAQESSKIHTVSVIKIGKKVHTRENQKQLFFGLRNEVSRRTITKTYYDRKYPD